MNGFVFYRGGCLYKQWIMRLIEGNCYDNVAKKLLGSNRYPMKNRCHEHSHPVT
jgi:hypothetical protein